MRRVCRWGGLAILLGCGGSSSAPPPSNVPAQVAAVDAPDAAAAPQNDPPGLTAYATINPTICTLSEMVPARGIDLLAGPNLAPFAHVSGALANVSVGNGGALFAEVKTSSWVVRGLPIATLVPVYPAHWIGFGGVFYPGIHESLPLRASHDGKVVLTAPTLDAFTLAPSAATMNAQCTDISLTVDPSDAMEKDVPPAFEPAPKTKPQAKLLLAEKEVPLSADVDGPPAGSFRVSFDPIKVTLLETHGKRARIRWQHLAGWVDASLLTTPRALSAKDKALQAAATLKMVAVASSGASKHASSSATSGEGASVFTCAADVRLFTSGVGGVPTVVGSIPAGQLIRLTDQGADSAHVSIDDESFAGSTHALLSVPVRDLVSGCTAAPAGNAANAANGMATMGVMPISKANAPDAIDLIDMTPEQKALALLQAASAEEAARGLTLPPVDLSNAAQSNPRR